MSPDGGDAPSVPAEPAGPTTKLMHVSSETFSGVGRKAKAEAQAAEWRAAGYTVDVVTKMYEVEVRRFGPETPATPAGPVKKTNRGQTMMLKKLAAKFGIEGFEANGELGSLPMTPANVEALRKMIDSPQLTPGYRTTLSTLIPNESAGPAAKLSSTQWSTLHNIVKWKTSDAFEGEFVPGKVFKPTQADLDRIAKYADDYAAQFGDKALPATSLRSLLKKFGYKPSEATPGPAVDAPSGLDPMPYEVSFAKKALSEGTKSKLLDGITYTQKTRIGAIEKKLAENPGFQQAVDSYAESLKPMAEGQTYIAVPADRIEAILSDGRFKTVHEKVASTGGGDGEGKTAAGYITGRREYENQLLADPTKVKPAQRPVYGYVGAKPGESGQYNGAPSDSVGTYGGVHFELKPELAGRTSITFGDSLNGASIPVMRSDVGGADSMTIVRSSIPGDLYWASADQTSVGSPNVQYVEAQVHGGVSLSHVAAVHVDLDSLYEKLNKYRDQAEDESLPSWQRQSALKVHTEVNAEISKLKGAIRKMKEAGLDVRTY